MFVVLLLGDCDFPLTLPFSFTLPLHEKVYSSTNEIPRLSFSDNSILHLRGDSQCM